MASKLVILLGMVALSHAAALSAVPVTARLEELDAVPNYSFAYDVQDTITGDSKAQYESRNGDVVRGSYSLIEADGTRRVVEYTADPVNGFNAVVSRQPLVLGATPIATAPLVPYAPVVPSGPVAPAAPQPAIPASGPDSDVEVVDTRSGPLRKQPEPSSRRSDSNENSQGRQQIQDQHLVQLERIQQQQRDQLKQLQEQHEQLQAEQQRQQRLQQEQLQQRRDGQKSKEEEREREEIDEDAEEVEQRDQKSKPVNEPAPVLARSQPLLTVFPARIAAYPAYTTYTNTYPAPVAYATPLGNYAYANVY